MKKSDCSGCEKAEQSGRSSKSGAVSTEPSIKEPADEPRSRPGLGWLWIFVRYLGAAAILALLYLLSYGPVDRYYNKPVTLTTDPSTFMASFRVRPAWVEIFYRPAFYLRMRNDLYNRYISRWNSDDSSNLIL